MNSTKDDLAIMVTLQQCEKEMGVLEADLAKVEARIVALNDQLAEYEKRVSDGQQHIEELKQHYRSSESEIKTLEAQVAKSQEKLRAVKTNKEYQSTLKEIDDIKGKASEIEDEMLEDLDGIEAAETELVQTNADLDDVKMDVESQRKEIISQSEGQKKALTSCRQEHEQILGRMPAALIEKYTKVKRQGRGTAIAAVVDSICQACRMNLPPQFFNELMRMDAMRMCPNCQRIIYPAVAMDQDAAVGDS